MIGSEESDLKMKSPGATRGFLCRASRPHHGVMRTASVVHPLAVRALLDGFDRLRDLETGHRKQVDCHLLVELFCKLHRRVYASAKFSKFFARVHSSPPRTVYGV